MVLNVVYVDRMSARKAQKMVLDFTGIWDPPKLVTKPVPSTAAKLFKPKKKVCKMVKKHSRVLWALCVVMFLWLVYRAVTRSTSRHIRHIPCKQKRGSYTCKVPARWTGDVVVEMSEACSKHVFEIGNVPFTHAQWNNMFRVPVLSQIHIRDAFTGCTPRAYVDNHAVLREDTDDLVWCAAEDHTTFSVTLDGDMVLEAASGNLLQPETNGVWTCYTYTLTSNVNTILVVGNGQTPIHVYERPQIVVSE